MIEGQKDSGAGEVDKSNLCYCILTLQNVKRHCVAGTASNNNNNNNNQHYYKVKQAKGIFIYDAKLSLRFHTTDH